MIIPHIVSYKLLLFRNSGQNYCMRLVDTPAGNICDFVCKFKNDKKMASCFDADNEVISV